MRKIVLFHIIMLLSVSSLIAGGYQVRLQGQRQTGIGLIGTSLFGDASSLFYNPAGLSRINGKYSFSAGMSAIMNSVGFRLNNTYNTVYNDNPVGTPLYFYGSAMVTNDLGFGIGVYTPYGTTAVWGDDWIGAQLIQDLSLQAVFIQPTLSCKFGDLLSIGAGFVIVTGGVELSKAIPYNSPEVMGQTNLQGSTSAYGYNLGLLLTPGKKWSIGANYRSEVTMSLEEGDAVFTVPASIPEQLIPRENTFNAELPLPANLDFGISYQATDKLLLAAEVNYVFWDVYDSLKFEFSKNPAMLNSSNPRKYSNTLIPRIGAEYKFSDIVTGRIGFYYDPTPTNNQYFTPETPSLTTYAFTLGLSVYPIENFAIELSYLHLETQQETKSYVPDNFTGDYKSRTLIPGVGLRYNF
ncbi:MAG TPA: outer membrane protein transport protein [Bacteroidales bacterium]|nr:outer membrane protein transport protein [Bacteroidales bacterium]